MPFETDWWTDPFPEDAAEAIPADAVAAARETVSALVGETREDDTALAAEELQSARNAYDEAAADAVLARLRYETALSDAGQP